MSDQKKTIPNYMKFIFGGTAGILAICVVQPFDLVKTRMQMGAENEYRSSLHCLQTVVSKEGFLGLYTGLSAAVLRQATYTTTRLGIYSYMVDQYRAINAHEPTVVASMAMGIIAGGIGAFVGTPTDVALIRMSSDGRLPPAERRNYTNVFNALARMVKEEGVTTLWRGSIPTVTRAMVVNMSQLASYSQFKSYFHNGPLQMKEGIGLHFAASMLSGLITTVNSMPLDIAKTRLQNMKTVNGKQEYRGTLDVLLKVGRNEGLFAFWKGFTPYYLRVAPQTVLIFIFLEQLNKLYSVYVLGQEGKGSGL